jgi:hypothetical protein
LLFGCAKRNEIANPSLPTIKMAYPARSAKGLEHEKAIFIDQLAGPVADGKMRRTERCAIKLQRQEMARRADRDAHLSAQHLSAQHLSVSRLR